MARQLDDYEEDEEVKESLRHYKESGYIMINGALRFQNYEKIEESDKRHIANIDSVMVEGESMILHRGIKDCAELLGKIKGNILIDKGFTSASKKESRAENFAYDKKKDKKLFGCVISFKLPSNIKRYEYRGDNLEKEVLIQRNTMLTLEMEKEMIKNGFRYIPATIRVFDPRKTEEEKKNLEEVVQEIREIPEKEEKKEKITEEDIEMFASSWARDVIEEAELSDATINDAFINEVVEINNRRLSMSLPQDIIEIIKLKMIEKIS